MAESRQPHLNGAYYGPSIPPPAKTYHRTSRGGSGCGCLGCCGCCLLSLLFNIIITLAVTIGLAVLIFWLILRPNMVKFHITDASLTKFDFITSDSNLHYKLALNVTIRNPNRRIGIHYDRIEARAYYEDHRFAAVTLTPFYQGHKNTTFVSPVFEGQNLVLLGSNELKELNKEKISGVYNIDVKLRLRVRFKVGLVKTWRFRPNIKCDLKVPLSSSNGTRGSEFETTKCHVDL